VLDQLFELIFLFHHHIQDLNHREYVFHVEVTKIKTNFKERYFFLFNYLTVGIVDDDDS
jgi:hypothetical protein